MFRIDSKSYIDEIVDIKTATIYTNNKEIKVIDMIISYKENNKIKNHSFESVERLDYLQELNIGNEIERKGVSDYLFYENNDLVEKGMDISYKVDAIIPDEDIIVKCKRIDEDKINISIAIDKIKLYCEETVNIPLKIEEV